jgi:Uma2 family endonuclease
VQGEIFKVPPHLCIEILSKDDTILYMQEKIDDYLSFGVPYIWIINRRLRKGYAATKAGVSKPNRASSRPAIPTFTCPSQRF